ncbi:MAG: hypothetical protein P1U85_15785 [Verrucomicrobiales bacterium]|nr:hypothetical protein [Verrucomicrobiales bacterium]
MDPDSSFLEVWMNIFSLESIASVKIERMRISRAEIELMGNAEEASQALEFIEELSTSDMFQGYAWEFHPPNIAAGGAATFEIKGGK